MNNLNFGRYIGGGKSARKMGISTIGLCFHVSMLRKQVR